MPKQPNGHSDLTPSAGSHIKLQTALKSNKVALPSNKLGDKPRRSPVLAHVCVENMASFEEQVEAACEAGDLPGVVLVASGTKGNPIMRSVSSSLERNRRY
jgi:hypothetical protein